MKLKSSMFIVVVACASVLTISARDIKALNVGDKAPDFTLLSTKGNNISIRQFQEKKPVVLFFYISAFGGA